MTTKMQYQQQHHNAGIQDISLKKKKESTTIIYFEKNPMLPRIKYGNRIPKIYHPFFSVFFLMIIQVVLY